MKKQAPILQKKDYKQLFEHSKKHLPIGIFKGIKLPFSRQQLVLTARIYLFPLIAGGAYLTLVYTTRVTDITLFYLIETFLVVVATRVGGRTSGALAILIGAGGAVYLLQPHTDPAALMIFLVFLLLALTISHMIDQILDSDRFLRLAKKEEAYARLFVQQDEQIKKQQQEIKARDEFLSIVSHELKTPLTAMLLQLHNMLHNIRNVSLAKFSVVELMNVLENAEKQINTLAKMINDLLDVSLITTGRFTLDTELIDLSAVTRDVIKNFSQTLKREGYRVTFSAKEPVMGTWDKTKIEQVVTNLISNAIKYGEKKPISIQVAKRGGFAHLMVKDQGIGIRKDKKEVLFQRFKRVVSDNGQTKGLGVGLYMANQIVKAHGGKIRVTSAPGRGALFTVELPVKK